VRVPWERAEEARAVLLGLVPEGFEERERGGELELAAYTSEAGEARLREALGAVEVTDVAPGWEEAWRRFHRPARIGPLWVGPPWQEPEAGRIAVIVDPGRAFGTGAHATTRLCLELLVAEERGSVVDLGCGSGVVAIAAAKLGFEPVVALDHDAAAVAATRANAAANGVALEARRCDVLRDPLPEAALGIANIGLAEVEAVARRFSGPRLIVSGYLAGERPRLARRRSVLRRTRDGWAADVLERF
jgi:ribosomal protein L11 methyltransferase